MSFVVGTAGHIDHGKSTLITALTGIDPDRLAEEKRRGMTIDLGFAHMTLPGGREIDIAAVPGHARIMRNKLAGAHGLDAVLLVVAADEGVMPQTREHLAILDLLEVRRGLVVLTKVDLVEIEWLDLVKSEVTAALDGTSLERAPMIAVSAPTGQGLGELVAALDALLAGSESRPDAGRPRIPIDRVFTISGFGTVVTGTLVDGSISVGEEMQVAPSGKPVRIRGLQRHNQKVESVGPGSRVAANLGGVDKNELSRGDVLARPGAMEPVRRVDARVRFLASAPQPVRHGAEVLMHTGTTEVGCRVIMLDGDHIAPGAEGWVQLYLDRPIAAAVQGLIDDGRIVERNGSLASPDHSVVLETRAGPAAELMSLLGRQPFAPPSLPEAMQKTGASDELVRALVERGDVVRVGDDVAFTKEAYASAVVMVKEIIAVGGPRSGLGLRHVSRATRRTDT